jgi:hypothetical protein
VLTDGKIFATPQCVLVASGKSFTNERKTHEINANNGSINVVINRLLKLSSKSCEVKEKRYFSLWILINFSNVFAY